MNHVLCPECFAKTPGEEKCCSHGCFDAKCVACGKVRTKDDPFWSCLGTISEPAPSKDSSGG